DDEPLPNLSELLGIPTRPPNTSSETNTAHPSLPTYLPLLSVRATTYDGKSLYIKRRKRVTSVQAAIQAKSSFKMGNLLDVPIHRLMDELSSITAEKLSISCAGAPQEVSRAPQDDTLWVDRYRPLRFTELLGNERVARETMEWVKQWDWCVFGRRKSKKRPREGDENHNPDDEYHRPHEKLFLLSGPPGLGKTTLAHVIAQQAGYEVMEINASDARSGLVVEERIQPALESGSAIGSSKPVLIIIDEIDGATGAGDNTSGFVQKLVSLTYDAPKKGKGKQKKDKRPLLRPIICICNDLHAPALAKLRPHARQVRLTRPADIHIVKRLREICQFEDLKADSRALTTLVGVARGDLRGCLNTLQFIKSKSEEVTEPLIRRATVGMKEADTTVTSVLNDLFAPMSRKRVKELGLGEDEEARYVNRLSREVEGLNNPNSVAVGCFAHYINCRQHDATLAHYEKANDWLVTFDTFSSIMYTDGDFGLHSYLSYFLVPFYSLFKERGAQRVEKDQTDWENLQRTRTNEQIYKDLSQGIRTACGRNAGDYRHLVTGNTLQLEFAPFINRIISPPLRPVNSQVIKPAERALLSRLVDIMTSLELRFVQEKAEDGQLVYRLDPPIDVFVTYDGKRAADIAISRYAVRHLVAAEIDAALIARHADAVERGKTKTDYFKRFSFHHSRIDPSGAGPANKRARTDLTDIADRPPVDFFGRLITVPSISSAKEATRKNVKKDYRVTYRFLEGNSAAVRKPLKLASFL
ncbi:hypothetical protein SERLA73DRAFT_60018, partial [Serpula lacrymans var. lacrymans S7.3]